MTIRVVVADDQALVRSGLAMILESQPDLQVVGLAADGNAAIEVVRAERPGVVLMDIRVPAVDGLAATRILTADHTLAATRIVVLTTYDLDEYLFGALQAGAAGFLLKGAAPEELIRAVREVAAGGCLLAPSATCRLIAEFVDRTRPSGGGNGSGGRQAEIRRRVESLTPREREVLGLMSRGLSNSEIAETLIVATTP